MRRHQGDKRSCSIIKHCLTETTYLQQQSIPPSATLQTIAAARGYRRIAALQNSSASRKAYFELAKPKSFFGTDRICASECLRDHRDRLHRQRLAETGCCAEAISDPRGVVGVICTENTLQTNIARRNQITQQSDDGTIDFGKRTCAFASIFSANL